MLRRWWRAQIETAQRHEEEKKLMLLLEKEREEEEARKKDEEQVARAVAWMRELREQLLQVFGRKRKLEEDGALEGWKRNENTRNYTKTAGNNSKP